MFADFPKETVYGYPVPGVFGADDAGAALTAMPREPRGGPLALYVHIPFCSSICRFCGFTRTDKFDRDAISAHTQAAIAELDLVARQFALEGRRLDAIFFGGGTASLLPLDQVESLLRAASRTFRVDHATERTFEGDALSLRRADYLAGLSALGFRRLSYGVQTTHPGMRKVLNLKPRLEDITAVHERARDLFAEVCVDFIYGWPDQAPDQLEADLEALVEAVPVDSLDVFQFETLDANPAFMRHLYNAGLRDLTTARLQELRRRLVGRLEALGYRERGYTYFTRRATPVSAVGYGSCYYGLDDGGVVGIGRGAQSFVDGAMWGNALDSHHWFDTIAKGRIPAASFAPYAPGEREAVNWPRPGRISRTHPWVVGEPDYAEKLVRLGAAGMIAEAGDDYVLTERGRDWVPSLLEFLMPTRQHARYRRELERFDALIRH